MTIILSQLSGMVRDASHYIHSAASIARSYEPRQKGVVGTASRLN